MKLEENYRYVMFGRVDIFGKANAADFAPDSEGGKRLAALAQILRDLESAQAGQQLGRAVVKDATLEALQNDLRNILRTARAVAQDEPGLASSFRAPKGQRQTAIVAAVDAVLLELNKPGVADKFIAHALPANFVEQLAADRAAVLNAQDVMEGVDHFGVLSTAAIGRLMRSGMKEVKYLDAIVRNQYTHNPDQLRAWVSASTLERPARRKKEVASSPTAGVVPAVPASSTTDGAH